MPSSQRPHGRIRVIAALAGMTVLSGLLLRANSPLMPVPDPTPTPTPVVVAYYDPNAPRPPTAEPSATRPPQAQLHTHAVAFITPDPTDAFIAPTVTPFVRRTLPPTVPGPAPDYSIATDDLRIEIRQFTDSHVIYYTAEIWLTDIMQLKSAFSSDGFDASREPVQDIADRNGALIAINGDFATFNNGGIIIRNGRLYRANRSTRQLLAIDFNGDFIAYTEPPENAEEAAARFLMQGIWHTFVFGPLLVKDGEAVPLPETFFVSTGTTLEPRTAIAQLGPLHYLWIVVDGRQENHSQGVSLTKLQEMFIEHGAITAFNLDGGGSSTLYFMGNIINQPANGDQRYVPDILFVAPH